MMKCWYDEYYDDSVGSTGSVYQLKSWGANDPHLVRGRPIGFMADIDKRPVYRVEAGSRKLPKQVK